MATQSAQPATNERIVRLLAEVKTPTRRKREERIARDLTRSLKRK